MAESPNEKKFMREKIVRPPVDRRQLALKAARLLGCAVMFGLVAAVTFAVSEPVAEKFLPGGGETQTIPITIEKDTEPSQSSVMETMEETTEEAIRPEELQEEIEQVVGDSMKNFTWSAENAAGFYQVFQDITQQADKGIVTVSAVRRQVDLFDNPVESAGQYAGIIVAMNPKEVIILTGESAVAEADALDVIFGDGNTAAGEVKQRDTVAQLAAVSVQTADIPEATLNWIEAIELGNSYMVKSGEPVVAVGSPAGRVHSVGHGIISYVAKSVQVPDGQTRVFYSDVDCDVDKGTFFLNLSGQLVGWATERFAGEDTPDVTMVMSVSEYKGMLQRLSNGIEIPYVGLMGQDVTDAMAEEDGIPKGVYITEAEADSPAYRAGIQSGDILTALDGEELLTVRDFQNRLEEVNVGETLTFTVQRKGQEQYKEIEYQITAQAR